MCLSTNKIQVQTLSILFNNLKCCLREGWKVHLCRKIFLNVFPSSGSVDFYNIYLEICTCVFACAHTHTHTDTHITLEVQMYVTQQ